MRQKLLSLADNYTIKHDQERQRAYGLNQYEALISRVLFGCILNRLLKSCENLKSLA